MRRRLAQSWYRHACPAYANVDHAATLYRLLTTRPVYDWWRHILATVLDILGTPPDTMVTVASVCLAVLAIVAAVRWRRCWRGWRRGGV